MSGKTLSPARPRPPRWPIEISTGGVLVLALVVVVGFLVLYPLGFLVAASFAPPAGAADQGLSLEGYRRAPSHTQARTPNLAEPWVSGGGRGVPGLSPAVLPVGVTRANRS